MIQITGKNITVRTLRERVKILIKKYLRKAKLSQGKSGIEIEVTELDDLLQHIADLMNEFQNTKSLSCPIKSKSNLGTTSYQKGFETREEASTSVQEIMEYADIDNIANEVDVSGWANENKDTELTQETRVEEGNESQKLQKIPLAQRNILTPVRKRSYNGVKQNTVQYLVKKNERNYKLRCRELALQEQKQLLEQKKHEVDVYERKQRLLMDERRVEMEEKRLKVELEIFGNQQKLIEILLNKSH